MRDAGTPEDWRSSVFQPCGARIWDAVLLSALDSGAWHLRSGPSREAPVLFLTVGGKRIADSPPQGSFFCSSPAPSEATLLSRHPDGSGTPGGPCCGLGLWALAGATARQGAGCPWKGLARGGPALCDAFAFAMTFFGLAPTCILFAMAVERCLALSHPYRYAQLDAPRCARRALPAIYAFCALFCALPLLGLGQHQQYCPGSWCFVRMRAAEPGGRAFSLAYAGLVALLVASIVLCNGSVAVSLCRMYRQQRRHQGGPGPRAGEDEVDHLLLLALMTGVMAVCSLPLTIRCFTQAVAPDSSEMGDLLAFRFYAFNPILDPWVFILFRKAVFQRLKLWLCCLCSWPGRGDSQTALSRPASGRSDPRAPSALAGKEGNWVPLSACGQGRGAPLPPAQQPHGCTVGTPSKGEAAVACPLC
ncbi:prostacyclin receptor [Carlito syrichta]|uniref:Prostacyclin receptor n=1 Tax=Carlito syrichta TaxID=1868482 RepID=A0A1U7T092_CARSF|nr:prostacyclin receptor [Carlito syrichta]